MTNKKTPATNVPTSNNSNDDDMQTKSPLSELLICVYKNKYIKLSTIFSLLLLAITGVYSIFTIVFNYADRETLAYKERLKEANKKNDILNKKYIELNEDFTEIKKLDLLPVLLNPVGGKKVTDGQVTFRWKYDAGLGFKNFILELKQIDRIKKNILIRRYDIPYPENKSMDFYFPDNITGEFFWRIGTGEVIASYQNELPDKEKTSDIARKISMHTQSMMLEDPNPKLSNNTLLWSRYGNFELYNSVLDKIIIKNEIVVGTTASFLSYDSLLTDNGLPNTYDMKFLIWLTKELDEITSGNQFKCKNNAKYPEKSVPTGIVITRKIIPWKVLFNNVANGKVDIAIANITRSKEREDKYHGMKFTEGYRDNHQKIIYLIKEGKYPDKLTKLDELKKAVKGKVIATQKKTINFQAANYLMKKKSLNFKQNNNHYKSYVEVINAIRHSQVDFGLIDEIRLKSVSYPDIGVVNYNLDELLDDFYRNELGEKKTTEEFGGEKYAVAVSTGGKESCLLEMLNEIIASDNGKKMRLSLEKKY